MRFQKRSILSCLLVLSLSMILGCGKKDGGTTPDTGAGAQAAAVDTTKPISEVQAEANTMSVDSLKATALKYKEAILVKQGEIEKLAGKIKEMPISEALGQEAKTLKTELENVEASLKALKDRFQVYVDTLKQKGADLTGLTL